MRVWSEAADVTTARCSNCDISGRHYVAQGNTEDPGSQTENLAQEVCAHFIFVTFEIHNNRYDVQRL